MPASTILGTQSITLPVDTTANRPTAVAGALRYNSDLGWGESYDSYGTWRSPDSVLFTHHFEDATRNIAVTLGPNIVPITFTFTKRYAASHLIVRGNVPISGNYSYQTGEYLEIGGTRKYEAANYMCAFNDGDDAIYGTMSLFGIWTDQLTTGSKTVNIGWSSRSGESGAGCGRHWNPDQRSGRTWARTTVIEIFEVDPGSITNIT
jgi:hypothetical protein